MKKISFCTVCMNRLQYLSQTLPVNIAENRDYPDLEFVVLNYNSKDDMENWVGINMRQHIESGLLKYYKTTEPEYFILAHSKNMAMRLATGDILCNIDADNFAGPGFATWIASVFEANGPDTFITTIRKDAIPYRDQGGKLCYTRDLFNAVNGLDESLIGYGMDDVDLANRLEIAGGKRYFIEEEKFLQFIGHSDQERVVNYRYPNNLDNIYISIPETSDVRSKMLYLFKDNTAAEMHYRFDESIKNNQVVSFVGWTIGKDGRREATYERAGKKLILTFSGCPPIPFITDEAGELQPENRSQVFPWTEIKKESNLYFHALMGYNECLNRRTLVENERTDVVVNKNGWGRGTVYINLDPGKSVQII